MSRHQAMENDNRKRVARRLVARAAAKAEAVVQIEAALGGLNPSRRKAIRKVMNNVLDASLAGASIRRAREVYARLANLDDSLSTRSAG